MMKVNYKMKKHLHSDIYAGNRKGLVKYTQK